MHALSHAADYIQDLSFLGEEDEEEAAPRRTKKRGKDGACCALSHTLSTICAVWGPHTRSSTHSKAVCMCDGSVFYGSAVIRRAHADPAFSPAADEDYEAPDGEGSEDFNPGVCAVYLYGRGSGERRMQLALLLCVFLGTADETASRPPEHRLTEAAQSLFWCSSTFRTSPGS